VQFNKDKYRVLNVPQMTNYTNRLEVTG